MDLHVHTTDEFTIEDVVAVGEKDGGFNLGVVNNVAPWKMWDDEALKKFFDETFPHPRVRGTTTDGVGLEQKVIAGTDPKSRLRVGWTHRCCLTATDTVTN